MANANMNSFSAIANGNISPMSFVINDPNANDDFYVLQSGANGKVIGVSQVGTYDPLKKKDDAADAVRYASASIRRRFYVGVLDDSGLMYR